MTSDKDRELQIELALLQIDAQVLTTAAFGLLAIFIAIMLVFQQQSILASDETMKSIYSGLTVPVGVVGLLFTMYLLNGINKVKKQARELKNRFAKKATELRIKEEKTR